MKRLIVAAAVLSALPAQAQAPGAGSVALGLGFGLNTAGVLGVEISARYLATDRVAVGCRTTYGWGVERTCGLNVYPFSAREWHLVAELGESSHGPTPVEGEPVRTRTWFTNLGAGIEDRIEDGDGGHYRTSRVHFTVGPSFVLRTRRAVDGGAVETTWGMSPRFFNHTEILLYPVLK